MFTLQLHKFLRIREADVMKNVRISGAIARPVKEEAGLTG